MRNEVVRISFVVKNLKTRRYENGGMRIMIKSREL